MLLPETRDSPSFQLDLLFRSGSPFLAPVRYCKIHKFCKHIIMASLHIALGIVDTN